MTHLVSSVGTHCMGGLNEYFASQSALGVSRNLKEEIESLTVVVVALFRRIKFINSDNDLDIGGDIAKIVFRDMRILPHYQLSWWKEMSKNVQKKMEERRSNCGNSVKQSIIGKFCFLMCISCVI